MLVNVWEWNNGEEKNIKPDASSHRSHINKCFDFSSVPHTFFWSLSTSLWSTLHLSKCFLFRGEGVTFPRDIVVHSQLHFCSEKSLCASVHKEILIGKQHSPSERCTCEILTRNAVLGGSSALGMIVLWRSCLYHILNRAGWEGQINEFSCFLGYLWGQSVPSLHLLGYLWG